MARPASKKVTTKESPGDREARTRARLLEAAGEAFAEHGFDQALGREIAIAAGTNPAAVNYHFGGKEGLYSAVLREADRRVVSLEQLHELTAARKTPSETLRAAILTFVRSFVSSSHEDWPFRVLMRELATPSSFIDDLFRLELLPKLAILRTLVAAVLKRPARDALVARCTLSVVSQLAFLQQNRRLLSRILPDLTIDRSTAEALADHIHRFSVGGMAATRRARKKR